MMLGLFSLSSLVSLEVRMKKYGRRYVYLSLPHLSCHIPQTPKVLPTVGAWWPAPIMHVRECLEGRWFQRIDLYSLIFRLIQFIKEPELPAAIRGHMREWARTPWSCENNHPEYDCIPIQHVKNGVPQLGHCQTGWKEVSESLNLYSQRDEHTASEVGLPAPGW